LGAGYSEISALDVSELLDAAELDDSDSDSVSVFRGGAFFSTLRRFGGLVSVSFSEGLVLCSRTFLRFRVCGNLSPETAAS